MERSFTRTVLFTTAGLLIWAADFLFIYAFAAVACARAFAGETVAGIGVVHFASAVSTAIAATATAAVLYASRRDRLLADQTGTFRAYLGGATALLALLAIALTGLPGVLVRGACQ